MVESTGLENRQPLIAVLGFKSLSLRHIQKSPPFGGLFAFMGFGFFLSGFIYFSLNSYRLIFDQFGKFLNSIGNISIS